MIFFFILAALNLLTGLSGLADTRLTLSLLFWLNGLSIAAWFVVSVILSFFPCSNYHHPVLCRGNGTSREVALTLDDGPDAVSTPKILDILALHDVPATFFCTGLRLQEQEALASRMAGLGHLVGNHSWSHSPWFDLWSSTRMRQELSDTDALIHRITGRKPLLFRPPYGVVNPMIHRALEGSGRHAVCWNIRSFDTMKGDPARITRRILRRLCPGSVILLHDHTDYCRDHLDGLLRKIREAGYTLVPLDKLLNINAYA